jgi:sec-independent protein translocase protein TatA
LLSSGPKLDGNETVGGFNIWHVLIVLVVVAVIFGAIGRPPNITGGFAKGIKAFRAGMRGDD